MNPISKKYIVCTTINPPTQAIKKFDKMKDWQLLVIGDLKTPPQYPLKRGRYIGPKAQEKIDKKLSDAIGWNCIQRRNFGFIIAHNEGAEIIASVDDDNIPDGTWGTNLLLEREVKTKQFKSSNLVFDPLSATEYKDLWHRGFPLEYLESKNRVSVTRSRNDFEIQADFWNGDPDVDAICRINHRPQCDFKKSNFPFSSKNFSPFNSQNTFFKKNLFPHYFLFPHIGRMDDIWASYYVQALGFSVVYGAPSVFQKRNPHSLVDDLANEMIGYKNSLNFVRELKKTPAELLKTSCLQDLMRHFSCIKGTLSEGFGERRGRLSRPIFCQ